jgi:hypothetical protein
MKRTTIATGVLALGMLLGTEAAQGVAGAALELRSGPSPNSAVTLVTGGDGAYAFTSVGGQGSYTLTVQPPQGWSLVPGQAASVPVSPGAQDTVVVDFVVRAN